MVTSYYPNIVGAEANARRPAHGCGEAGNQVMVLTRQLDDSPAEEWMDGVHADA